MWLSNFDPFTCFSSHNVQIFNVGKLIPMRPNTNIFPTDIFMCFFLYKLNKRISLYNVIPKTNFFFDFLSFCSIALFCFKITWRLLNRYIRNWNIIEYHVLCTFVDSFNWIQLNMIKNTEYFDFVKENDINFTLDSNIFLDSSWFKVKYTWNMKCLSCCACVSFRFSFAVTLAIPITWKRNPIPWWCFAQHK